MFEVNLVPALKHDAIRAMRVRNIILFVCIVASLAAVGIVLILFGIKAGQDITMANQDKRISTLSAKLNAFSDLSEMLTIQDQAENLQAISQNKIAMSRIFGFLLVLQDRGEDEVTFSSVVYNASTNTVTIEGQVDALTEPYIDYRVLEEFRKNAELITYDYGEYVDPTGTTIPFYCVSDTDSNGDHYYSEYYGAYYAIWNFEEDGCNPSDLDRETILSYNLNPDTGTNPNEVIVSTTTDESEEESSSDTSSSDASSSSSTSTASDTQIVDDGTTNSIVIYRTPLFEEWVRAGYMTTDGSISGVPHFASACVTYSSSEDSDGSLVWSEDNGCLAVPNGITITDSSNGTNESGQLVLRFDAQLVIDADMFLYSNHFMMWFSPTGANVTDSFVQIADMFAKRAEDCAEGDSTCSDITNSGGSN